MMTNYLDLSPLYSNIVDEIKVDETVEFNEEDLENSEIIKLKDVHVKGLLEKNPSEDIVIRTLVDGVMIIEDSISLEAVEYPFSFEIDNILDEMVKKDENTLDLKELLWENIVLEIPLKFTKVTDLSEFHGDGWKLVSEEDEIKDENPFNELLKDFGEE